MAEVEQKDSGGKKKGKQKKMNIYALYLYEQTSDDGNQHAVKR